MSHDDDDSLETLQLGLVRLQQAALKSGERIVIIFEGRDSAGKDGAIKRIVEHLSLRATRVAALPKPTDRQQSEWFFQRYIYHLPSAGELVIFNRSWYNRAGVERVMGFSTAAEQEQFLRDVPAFERMLTESGIRLVKLWLDISKKEQKERLDDRRSDPLKALKVSDLDAVAQSKWSDYSKARNDMLVRTHSDHAPWFVVRADHKKRARRAIIQQLLRTLAPKDIAKDVDAPDPDTLFVFEESALTDGRLAK